MKKYKLRMVKCYVSITRENVKRSIIHRILNRDFHLRERSVPLLLPLTAIGVEKPVKRDVIPALYSDIYISLLHRLGAIMR